VCEGGRGAPGPLAGAGRGPGERGARPLGSRRRLGGAGSPGAGASGRRVGRLRVAVFAVRCAASPQALLRSTGARSARSML
jgi:hypothetical protein